VGCDQLLILEPPSNGRADVFLRIRNHDGGEVGACGNGTRCVAALVMGEAADHPLLSSWPLFQAERDPVIVQTLCEDVDEALRHLGRPEGLDPGAALLIKTNAA
jgi:hypothetical protein